MALYSLSIAITGASSTTFCSANFTAGTFDNGGAAEFVPASAAYTYVEFQRTNISMYIAPGDAVAGAAITATLEIAGSIVCNPPINVPTVVTVNGSGTVLGTYTLPAGQGTGRFNISVPAGEAFDDAASATSRSVSNKKK
jgi:hypothetical protein